NVMDIGTTGNRFRYRDNSTVGNNVGDYIFPRDNGQPGQVLITNGVNPAAETAQLSWADVSSLTVEPWKVQNTTNDATDNTEDIYQQGKVAIGFTDADAVSDKQLEVKGDLKAEFLDDDNFMYGLKTAQQSPLDPSTRENLMYVTDNEDINAANIYSILGV